MSKSRIAAVGPKDTVLAFRALGIDVRPVDTPDEAARALFELAQEGYAVIFITEREAAQIQEEISRYKDDQLPAIIPIPNAAGSTGDGMRNVQANAEKAIGANILFQEEG